MSSSEDPNQQQDNAAFSVAELAGWYGTLAIIGAYALVSFNVISVKSLSYQLLNVTGAIGIIIISAKKGVRQSVVLNSFWALIALVALINIARSW